MNEQFCFQALNADGTLKDASEMEWIHDPDDEIPNLATLQSNIVDPAQPVCILFVYSSEVYWRHIQALNADGTLKDASELEWDYDPDDAQPNLSMLPQTIHQPPKRQPSKRPRQKKAKMANPFIDDEAQVSNDEEDEDDDGDESKYTELHY